MASSSANTNPNNNHQEATQTTVNPSDDTAINGAADSAPNVLEQPENCDGIGQGYNNTTQRVISFPPGYRFNPTDEELIIYYLRKKLANEWMPYMEFMQNKIIDVELYQHHPQYLLNKYRHCGEDQWYFFTPRDRKYPNGKRPDRAAGRGYWKATGTDKTIKIEETIRGVKAETIIGHKKALVFYEGKPPLGNKTKWIMHEYRAQNFERAREGIKDMRLDDCVLCRIYEKKPDKNIEQENEEHANAGTDSPMASSQIEQSRVLQINTLHPVEYVENNYWDSITSLENTDWEKFFNDEPEEATLDFENLFRSQNTYTGNDLHNQGSSNRKSDAEEEALDYLKQLKRHRPT